ncbi:phytoene/squalene synthase family protein [Pedobacter flavus]|uniref:Phytoene/squalene synthase family protein n=1 Tax=Pedobacter flavus TaxID=3113906 RepID=A0ABU7H346_9SPHI|nr:phytoene/squalene synthase family protein [Pedobacter sp. VNH31]MEE1885731.1 phytoene/squalene synthase family protein [Pedobacter sp. VNH31]
MKQLFDDLSVGISKMTTQKYSTSFSYGIYFLSPTIRNAIYSIYGFVRVADEIVDSFEGYDRAKLMAKFKEETYEAIEQKISTNPILNAFQQVVNTYSVEIELIDSFLKSMEMDLQKIEYTREKFNEYILGSAEVVGLMCLHVFCQGNKEQYEKLKPYAMKLGAAFQKVNFLRDLKDDYEILGRNYFPSVNFKAFTAIEKSEIESEIESDFKEALVGIKMLPANCKLGVYLAFIYYKSLFKKIKRLPASKILAERVRINNTHKVGLMINSIVSYKMRIL